MRLARVGPVGQEIPVVEVDGASFDLRPITDDVHGEFLGSEGLQRTRDALASGRLPELVDAGSLRVGAPLVSPGKIVCIGLNYRDHAEETRAEIPAEPVVFMKDASTIVGPHDTVYIPRTSVKTDWEVELGVVIGSTARYLESPADAWRTIAGYVLSHDVSEREFQLERGGQWDKGKNCPTFNPLGPWLVTPDEIQDVQALRLTSFVNGDVRQDSTTTDMVYGVEHLVWYISQFMTLYPGDVINTGTPAGVGMGFDPPRYLDHGDTVALSIDGLGRQQQQFMR